MLKVSLTDEQLVALIHNRDVEANNILAERYYGEHRVLLHLAGSAFLKTLGESESNHAFFVAYLAAVEKFRPGKGGSFRTYFVKILSHQILKSLHEETKNPLGNALSLDAPLNDENEDSPCFSDSCRGEAMNDPKIFLDYMEEAEQLGALPKYLDRKTLWIARLRIEGHSFEEIARNLHSTIRVVRGQFLRYQEFVHEGIKVGSFEEAIKKYEVKNGNNPCSVLKGARKKKPDDGEK